jgi:tetratricopeptide (TPR) repeat protein
MTLAIEVDDPEVAALPPVSPTPPAAIDRVVPLRAALGLTEVVESSAVTQARLFAASFPQSPTALVRLAQAAQAEGDLDQACEVARQVLGLAADDTPTGRVARHTAAMILVANSADVSFDVLSFATLPGGELARAAVIASTGDRDRAVLELQQSTSPLADAMLGWLRLPDDAGRAVAHFRSAMRKGLRSPDVLVNLGFAYAALGSVDRAARVTREATVVSPQLVVAAYNMAALLVKLNKRVESLAELGRIANELPCDVDVALTRAWSYVHLLGDYETAYRFVRHARKSAGHGASARDRTALDGSAVYLEYKLNRRSISSAKLALWRMFEAAPHVEVARMIGTLLMEREDAAALRYLIRATSDIDGFPAVERDLWDMRARCLEGDVEGAVSKAKACVQIYPTRADVLDWASYFVGEATGDYKAAAQLGERAFALDNSQQCFNNFVFALALAGEPLRAHQLVEDFGGAHSLPFYGATAALIELALGRLDEGRAIYQRAIEDAARDGDPELGSLIRWREAIACVQLGLEVPSHNLDEPAGDRYGIARTVMNEIVKKVKG